MRDINRIDIFLEDLKKLWKQYCPDWRFTQLVCNVTSHFGSDLFYCEENDYIEKLKIFFKDTFGEVNE